MVAWISLNSRLIYLSFYLMCLVHCLIICPKPKSSSSSTPVQIHHNQNWPHCYDFSVNGNAICLVTQVTIIGAFLDNSPSLTLKIQSISKSLHSTFKVCIPQQTLLSLLSSVHFASPLTWICVTSSNWSLVSTLDHIQSFLNLKQRDSLKSKSAVAYKKQVSSFNLVPPKKTTYITQLMIQNVIL